jgi:hypothetical protein
MLHRLFREHVHHAVEADRRPKQHAVCRANNK